MYINKKYSLPIRILKILFLAIAIISVVAYAKPFFNAKYFSDQTFKSIEDQSLGLIRKNQVSTFNNKTPRNLFTNFYYKSLGSWIGYHQYYYDVINCISPQNIKVNDHTISEQDINVNKMLVALLKTNFKLQDVPNKATGNKLDITLGTGAEKQTFYLAKKENSDWYFTQENFDNSKTTEKFIEYRQEKNFTIDNIKDVSMPILSYMRFIFGVNQSYRFDIPDAFATMDIQWVPQNIREGYASFVAFSMNKIFENADITFRNIPGEVLPGSNLVMIYTSPEVGKSIYLEYVKDTNTGKYSWIFTKQTLLNAVDTYLNDSNSPRDPLNYSLHYTIWENIPALLTAYNQFIYSMIIGIISLTLFYISYKLAFCLLSPVFRILSNIFENKDFKTIKKLNIATSLMISMYIGYFFFFNSMIIFVDTCYYIDLVFRIVYGIVIMFLCTEIVNVLCSFTISSYKKVKDPNRSARFAFALIIANKIINLIIILIITGFIIQELGIDMIHFLAALGIGGLAIALAGKDTIENLFGSIILAIERPIKIGDWVIIKDKEGIVEKIGLRSTTIRTFEDSALIIPNYAFVTSQINNMGERIYRRYMTTLEVDESTPTAKLRSYVDAINELIKNTSHMRKEGYYVRVNDLKPASIKILVYVFFISADWGEELEQREQFIMSMLDLAEEIGVKLAPSQKIQFDANYSD
ncbi:mechanosensitive ion channel family protein [Francisella philomiragia]|uniref:mechanosensitive ion channel family protein n=1 Tax=Francisella philomiragia TaxID=28110 RepID=UPI0021C9B126|nr:mechanosensitive ion channel family protein [Francisella philomiragia]